MTKNLQTILTCLEQASPALKEAGYEATIIAMKIDDECVERVTVTIEVIGPDITPVS